MNGALSFLELSKIINTSWKNYCIDFAKSVFNELAEQGREQYRRRLEEYNVNASSQDPKKIDAEVKEYRIRVLEYNELLSSSSREMSSGEVSSHDVDVLQRQQWSS